MMKEDELLQLFANYEDKVSQYLASVGEEPWSQLAGGCDVMDELQELLEAYVAKNPEAAGVKAYHDYAKQGLVMPDKLEGFCGLYPIVSNINAVMTWDKVLEQYLYEGYDERLSTMFFFRNVMAMFWNVFHKNFMREASKDFVLMTFRLGRLATHPERYVQRRKYYEEHKSATDTTKRDPKEAAVSQSISDELKQQQSNNTSAEILAATAALL